MLDLKNSEKALLILLKRSLFGSSEMPDDGTDWDEVYAEAKAQTVVAVAFDATAGISSVAPSARSRWMRGAASVIMHNENKLIAQKSLTELLTVEKIPYAIIKGTSAAIAYPRPELRALGDVDFLVEPKNIKRAQTVLSDNGYIRYQEEGEGNDCHIGYSKGTELFELHYRVSGMPNGRVGEYLSGLFEDAVSRAVAVKVGEQDFCMLPPVLHALTLLLHIYQHFWESGLGLRQICDWAVFAAGDMFADCREELLGILDMSGMLTMAKTITKMCVIYLGLPEDRACWCEDADEGLCDEIMHDIIRHGNFGRKLSGELDGAAVLSVDRTDTEDDRSLFKRRMSNVAAWCKDSWPICRRVPALLPIAPVYICLRYLGRVIIGKRRAVNPIKMVRESNSRASVIDRLEVFKTTE